MITEPIFAAGGVIVPPPGFLKGVRELCDKYGILLIFDEVVTGLGQTGTMFACEYEQVTPDILVTGKALTSGYVPGSAVMMRKEIGEKLDQVMLHGHTHSCYPLSCTAALKNIEIIERDHLVENSRDVGQYLHEQLEKLNSDVTDMEIRADVYATAFAGANYNDEFKNKRQELVNKTFPAQVQKKKLEKEFKDILNSLVEERSTSLLVK